MTIPHVPDSHNAAGMAIATSSHAVAVLRRGMRSLAATSAAVVTGRVASITDNARGSVAFRFGLLPIPTAKPAMTGGVSSIAAMVANTTAVVSLPGMNNNAAKNGSTYATIIGNDRPPRRHSNHASAWAGAANER